MTRLYWAIVSYIYTTGRTELDVGGTVVESRHPPPPPPSKRQRGAVDVMLVAQSVGGQLGVVVAPLRRTALLHMAPPRPRCRGLDEKASGADVQAALWRTSQGVQKPWQVCLGKRFLTRSRELMV